MPPFPIVQSVHGKDRSMSFSPDRRALLIALAMSPASIAFAADDPGAPVAEAYRISAGPDGKWEGANVLFDDKALERLFSAAFVKAFRDMKAQEEKSKDVILDFDPISASQDPSVNDLTIKTESRTGDRALVVARFHYEKGKDPWTVVKYDMARENGVWKIDDIAGEVDKDRWSVREIMRGAK